MILLNKLICFTRFVQNGIDFLYHIEISLIIGVFNTCPPPGNIRQLACRQRSPDIATSWKTQDVIRNKDFTYSLALAASADL